jgi:hypothetical protein
MPIVPTNYQKAVIYKIQHNEKLELLYIGSTTDFDRRKYSHKNGAANVGKKPQRKHTYIYELIHNNGGWNCFTMTPLKQFPCKDVYELHHEEAKLMLEMKATLNSKLPMSAGLLIPKGEIAGPEMILISQKIKQTDPQLSAQEIIDNYKNSKGTIYRKMYYEKNKERLKKINKENYERKKNLRVLPETNPDPISLSIV